MAQDRVDGGIDRVALGRSQKVTSESGVDADGGLGTNRAESGLKLGQWRAGDDLGRLHGLAGSHVERGHVLENISVPYDRK